MNSKSHDYVFKCVIIGDSCIGKSTLLRIYMGEKWDPNKSTANGHKGQLDKVLQTGLVTKTVKRRDDVVLLKLFDTLGQEKYKSLTQSYYMGAFGCLLCFDVNDMISFNNLESWLEALDQRCNIKNVAKLLVGIVRASNDEAQPYGGAEVELYRRNHRVKASDAIDFARSHCLEYIEVKLNEETSVNQCFDKLITLMVKEASNSAEDDLSWSTSIRKTADNIQPSHSSSKCAC